MGRKKSNISQYSRNAKRLKKSRSQESMKEQEVRRAYARDYVRMRYVAETPEQRENRLMYQRLLTAARRASYTPNERQLQRAIDRERHRLSRQGNSETYLERENRLLRQRIQKAASRARETSEERMVRLELDRERHRISRMLRKEDGKIKMKLKPMPDDNNLLVERKRLEYLE